MNETNEMNENEKTTTQNLWDSVKAVLRGRFIAVQLYLKKQDKSQINNLDQIRLVARSCPTLATPWTAAHQAPLSMGFSRQKYWSGMCLGVELGYLFDFFRFLRYACIAMNFTLSTAFTVSHRFWVVVFSFSFISMHILISLFYFFCD